MVYYCSVKGCKNNSKMKKKDPNIVLSFHAFPVKEVTKQKWLRAIGRPSWKPPSFARICSAHFNLDQISHEGCRTRMMEDACPVKDLPPNSNFEASDVEVCRICLGTDMKMFSLQEGLLNTCLQSLTGLKENCTIEGLPQLVCYECSARLINCYNLIEQSCIAQAVLLDIFNKNGQVTKKLVKTQDRTALGLESSLQSHITTDLNQYIFKEFNGNSLNKVSEGTYNTETNNLDIQLMESVSENNYEDSSDESEMDVVPSEALNNVGITTSGIAEASTQQSVFIHHEYAIQEENTTENDLIGSLDASKIEMGILTENEDDLKMKGKLKNRKEINKENNSNLTPTEKDLLQYFKIATLTRKQQKQQWERVTVRSVRDCRWECEVCYKQFATELAYTNHKARHDPSHGEAKCPICYLRYKTDKLLQTHKKSHENIFYCKFCPSAFYNAKSAKTHRNLHTNHTYSTQHASALTEHTRLAHASSCVKCGRPVSEAMMNKHIALVHPDLDSTDITKESPKYPCPECNIELMSEEARRVHLLTSKEHRKIPDLCDPVPPNPYTKNWNMEHLVAHMNTEHPGPQHSSQTTNKYPVKCKYCEEILNNRSRRWVHMRSQHPGQKQTRASCVCQHCGKQFQNSTKLRAHELSHGPAAVPCPSCARTFHHKYALARHAATHARAAHACHLCARTFTNKHNLKRHQRVHTGETPYACNLCDKRFKHSTGLKLHVRSVHCNLPPPKRSKLTVESE